jgi:predicted lipoprotein with Yx(FWY)xxD motif
VSRYVKTRKRLTVVLAGAVLALSACAGSVQGTASGSLPTSTSTTADGAKPKLVDGGVAVNEVPADSGDFAKYTADSPPATKTAAMRWTALGKAKIIDLDPVVVNANGMVLYRFNEDTASPSKSHCTGSCVETWLPVLIAPTGTIYFKDIPKSAIGTVEREDGTLQVTLGGQPIYRYAKDETVGDRNGQGVDDAWFGVRPDGGKATPEASGADISITLYPDKNLGGDSLSTSGPGCQNLSEPGVASSLEVSGGEATIWSGEDCTGESAAVKGKVDDLSTIDFDDKVASVKFGG